MSTILTDDEIWNEWNAQGSDEMSQTEAASFARAVEAAVLAKLAQQEPVAWLFQHDETGLTKYVDTQQVEWGFEKNNPRWHKIGPVYTHPAPQQADRQRVPEGWKLVPVEPPEEMARAGAQYAECGLPANAVFGYRAMLAAAPEAPAQADRQRVPDSKAIAECLAVLRPMAKGKFPQEQALEELAGYLAATPEAPAQADRQRVPSRAEIREVFLANGFTIKDGQTDLKPYVYAAAHALLNLAAAPEAPAQEKSNG